MQNTGRTKQVQRVAPVLKKTSLTIYNSIRDASITILDSQLHNKNDLSAHASFERRSRKDKLSNHLKIDKVAPLIALVVSQLKTNILASLVGNKTPDEFIFSKKRVNRNLRILVITFFL
ncbi:MAG: hypothetical protein ACK5KR_05620 [Breznakia sp.]